eukprot:c20812_g3_i6.p3 GENE.c20812_g3_i6~~c20812_g3_i6.p3  ORF type:complete len:109 (-),score=19.04 c20812_g3_i6:475-801(-)
MFGNFIRHHPIAEASNLFSVKFDFFTLRAEQGDVASDRMQALKTVCFNIPAPLHSEVSLIINTIQFYLFVLFCFFKCFSILVCEFSVFYRLTMIGLCALSIRLFHDGE